MTLMGLLSQECKRLSWLRLHELAAWRWFPQGCSGRGIRLASFEKRRGVGHHSFSRKADFGQHSVKFGRSCSEFRRRPETTIVSSGNFEGKQAGQPIGDIKKSWKAVLKGAGITRPFRFHDLRHSCASQLVMNGASLMAVKEILGHESLKTTLRYAHLSPEYAV